MNVIILVVLSILPLLYFLVPGLPITHDGPDHVARIANFYLSLTDGNVVPRWAANLNWGYGHPILMFLYPFPSYVASVFHTLGFSFVDSTKLVFAVAFTVSILAMYLWVRRAVNQRAGVIAAVLYGFAPYRFVDMAVRGAIGEHVAFIFPPLIFYFLLRLAEEKRISVEGFRNAVYASFMTAALILSHNAVSIMFMPIILLYVIYLFFFVSKKDSAFLYTAFCSIACGFGLSAFFWIPAIFEGKYTLRDIVTSGGVSDKFIPWTRFIYSPWSYGTGNELSKFLGLAPWAGIISGLWVFRTAKLKPVRWLLGGMFIIFAASLIIMTSASGFLWTGISLLQKFQFPWRFLTVTAFASAVIGGAGIDGLCTRLQSKGRILFIGFIVLSVVTTYSMWKPKGYSVKSESYYSGVYNSTTDTGESSPIWSVRFMEHRPNDPMGIISGIAGITPTIRTSVKHQYKVSVDSTARLVENTLYFPGWRIYVDNEETSVEFQDPAYRGLMTYYIKKGEHSVSVVFTDTKLRTMANMISIIAFVLCVLPILAVSLLWQKNN